MDWNDFNTEMCLEKSPIHFWGSCGAVILSHLAIRGYFSTGVGRKVSKACLLLGVPFEWVGCPIGFDFHFRITLIGNFQIKFFLIWHELYTPLIFLHFPKTILVKQERAFYLERPIDAMIFIMDNCEFTRICNRKQCETSGKASCKPKRCGSSAQRLHHCPQVCRVICAIFPPGILWNPQESLILGLGMRGIFHVKYWFLITQSTRIFDLIFLQLTTDRGERTHSGGCFFWTKLRSNFGSICIVYKYDFSRGFDVVPVYFYVTNTVPTQKNRPCFFLGGLLESKWTLLFCPEYYTRNFYLFFIYAVFFLPSPTDLWNPQVGDWTPGEAVELLYWPLFGRWGLLVMCFYCGWCYVFLVTPNLY